MFHRARKVPALVLALAISLTAVPAFAFPVTFGSSWDGLSLQAVLDAEYGPGAINAATDYVGYSGSDPDPAYWEDLGIDGIIVREVAGYQDSNTFGWYKETFAAPTIDGVDDGVIFTGPMSEGQTATILFPSGLTRFGFYLNPNGTDDAPNAPEPEMFFTNRSYHDLGPAGWGAYNPPFDGDVQALIYDITHLRNGVPTFVIAWEDLDSGAEITPAYTSSTTDNDYQDLVVEITALSPVPDSVDSWGQVKALFRD